MKSDTKKIYFLRNIHFCVIQLTWSSQWKVFLKCRENLWQLSWMKFILKFPGPPGKPSLPKVNHLPPSQAEQLSKLVSKFLSSLPRQKEITHSSRQHYFENLFPPTTERVEETRICYFKIRFFIFCKICKFFKCDGFTVL